MRERTRLIVPAHPRVQARVLRFNLFLCLDDATIASIPDIKELLADLRAL